MIQLKLATGEIVNCIHVDRWMNTDLIIHTLDLTFMKAVELFSNPEAIKRLTIISEDEDIIYQGFTVLKTVQIEPILGAGVLTIILQR